MILYHFKIGFRKLKSHRAPYWTDIRPLAHDARLRSAFVIFTWLWTEVTNHGLVTDVFNWDKRGSPQPLVFKLNWSFLTVTLQFPISTSFFPVQSWNGIEVGDQVLLLIVTVRLPRSYCLSLERPPTQLGWMTLRSGEWITLLVRSRWPHGQVWLLRVRVRFKYGRGWCEDPLGDSLM